MRGKLKVGWKRIIKENTTQDFVVSENTEKQNEITFLKKGDIEQLGIYLCTAAELHSAARVNEQCISEYIILVDIVFMVLANSNSSGNKSHPIIV